MSVERLFSEIGEFCILEEARRFSVNERKTATEEEQAQMWAKMKADLKLGSIDHAQRCFAAGMLASLAYQQRMGLENNDPAVDEMFWRAVRGAARGYRNWYSHLVDYFRGEDGRV